MRSNWKSQAFIMEAHVEDAGEAACHTCFELSLGDLVMDFLGEGEWAPDVRLMVADECS